ncbi:hypothetical protein [Cytobacillus oceanisediminis]|uniref:hypothetical protein n=1 Tax=Cytobacillus oceanisediminis TaxID=665099 RepID=UPI00207A580C|nr:hypothetical protein [Cytobacillus oceanisediminis]USK45521.1 hypothetical protein LIT27_06645 [Cytobacillus oceanisediminis]
MGDILSSVSIIVAIIFTFYTQITAKVDLVMNIDINPHRGNRKQEDVDEVNNVLKKNIYPILALIIITSLALAPSIVKIIYESVTTAIKEPFNINTYNVVYVMLFVLFIVLVYLAVSLFQMVNKLIKKRQQLTPTIDETPYTVRKKMPTK